MELSNQDRLKLIHFLNFVCDYEASKPIEEMDEDLISACVKVLLELQDKHVNHSPEFIDEQVRKIFRKEETETTVPEAVKPDKKQINKKKIWLVAACIAILVALFSVISFSSEKGVKDVLEDFLGTFEFIPFGKEVDVDKETYIKESASKKYTSITDLVNEEKIDLLHPRNIDNTIELISIGQVNEKETIDIAYTNSNLFINITLNSQIPPEIIEVYNKKFTLNKIDYYICIMNDISKVQAYFIHNNNMYVITHKDEKELMEILNNMEEIRYED